ncbi:MAG: hypothetical protein O2856_17005, partial [Planctomycetota bacterium]|nr:hypothetical protein [Planctomycetota bacterium]
MITKVFAGVFPVVTGVAVLVMISGCSDRSSGTKNKDVAKSGSSNPVTTETPAISTNSGASFLGNVGDFSLTDQQGEIVTRKSLEGNV